MCAITAVSAFSVPYAISVPHNLQNLHITIVDFAYIGGHDVTIANAETYRLNSLTGALANLRSGATKAIIYDRKVLEYVAAKNPDLKVLDDTFLPAGYVFAITPSKPDLKTAVDAEIKELQKDGKLADMEKYWFSLAGLSGKAPEVIINIGDGEDDAIVYGTSADNEPFAFIGNDTKIIGYEIQLLEYVCQSANVQPFVHYYEHSQLLPAVKSGKLDIAGGFMADDPRLAGLLVSEPYFDGGLAIMVLK